MKIYLIILLWCGFLPMTYAQPRIVTSDWSTAETLVAMGYPPVSVGDKKAYNNWVGYPPISESTLDAGLRFQPNKEFLYQIKPDFFIQSPWFAFLRPQFENIAPVYEVSFATDNGINYQNTLNATRKIAALIKHPEAAESLIQQTEQQFDKASQKLSPYRNRPLAIVQFIDARHLRIYGKTSLFQVVLDKLHLHNAWQGESNQWGFTNINIIDLKKLPPNTILIIVQPHPKNVRTSLEKSSLWQWLPFSQQQNRRILSPSWSYGALPSMQRFAQQLSDKLPSQEEIAW